MVYYLDLSIVMNLFQICQLFSYEWIIFSILILPTWKYHKNDQKIWTCSNCNFD